MLRQGLIYLLLSTIIVVFAKYAHLIIIYIDMFFMEVNLRLTPLFSATGWGLVTRKIIVLMMLPLVLAGVPALAYRGIKGQDMPHFLAILWVLWTIIMLSNILL